EGVPVAAPDELDDVPAGAAEDAFEFLDDLAIAADRSVEALAIAVDDPGEVIEFFAGGDGDGAEGFGFVGFAIADEGPDAGFAGGFQEPAGLEVTDEPGLVNRVDGPEPHRDRGELPEIRHQPRMRIRGETALFGEFAPEILEMR